MGLLDKLWDDVVAGPRPDNGLGRLRNPKLSLSIDPSAMDEDKNIMFQRRRSGEFQYSQEEARRLTQSIAIVKPSLKHSSYGPDDSLPSTPSGTSIPLSPSLISPEPRSKGNVWKSAFHSGSKALDRNASAKFDEGNPHSPTVYDWWRRPHNAHEESFMSKSLKLDRIKDRICGVALAPASTE